MKISYMAQYVADVVEDLAGFEGPYSYRALMIEKRWARAIDDLDAEQCRKVFQAALDLRVLSRTEA